MKASSACDHCVTPHGQAAPHGGCRCCRNTRRRRHFLATAGASAAAMQLGLLDFAASLMAGQSPTPSKPALRAAMVRPKDAKGYWMTFTGPGYDAPARMAEFTRIMSDAARQLDVPLDVYAEPLCDEAAANQFLAQCQKSPPDGILLVLMCQPWWSVVNHVVEKRGQVPTLIFAPVGTTFTDHHAATRSAPRTFQAATQDPHWLADGVRMLATIARMKRARVCVLGGTKSEETQVPGLGVTLRRLPLGHWMDQFRKAPATEEVRAIAGFYAKAAKKIVEPKPEDVLNAAKCYVVARKIMAAEQCQGISVDCMPLIGQPGVPCGPCLAWSKLNDELLVGACEADVDAICSLLLAHSLLRRPGFVQDPVPNTINNTLIGAHCSCPTRLAGPDKPPAPLILRSDNGTNYGCATQVLWPVGEPVTVMEFNGPKQIILGTGKVVSNVDTTVSGGCRTSVEVALDQGGDPRDYRGFHQLFLLGKWDRMIKAYGQLAGIEVAPI